MEWQARLGLILLLLLSAGLLWHDLGVREVLGRDENATITKLDQPSLAAVLDVTPIKVTGQPGNMQPLYFLVQHLVWPLVGRSAFVLRFMPAAFGLLVVALTFRLGQSLVDVGTGMAGALLLAVFPLHVRYAQIARPYTLLALLSVASAWFLIRAIRRGEPSSWVPFVITAALNLYTHYNALFALAAQGLYAAVVWLVVLVDSLGRREFGAGKLRVMGPPLAFATLGLLCLPGLIRLFGLPWLGTGGVHERGGEVMVQLTEPFFRHFLFVSGVPTIGFQNLFAGLLALGWVVLLIQRRWASALFAALWIAVPFCVLSVIHSPRPFAERYVIFVMPVALLLVAHTLVAAARILTLPLGAKRKWRQGATLVLVALFAALLSGPLSNYYANNRAEDRLDQTLQVVERHASEGDLVLVSPRFFTRALDVGVGVEVRYLTEHLADAELDALAADCRRMWILYTSYLPPAELQEPLDGWVQNQDEAFVRVAIKSITALAFGATHTSDLEADLGERIVILDDLAQHSAGKYEAWQRYGVLADAYETLAELYRARGDAEQAAAALAQAAAARAAAPQP